MERKWESLIVVLGTLMFCIGGARFLCLPLDDFATRIVIDDALYFLVPAQNLVAGLGFSFDGVYPTNGVQILWALVTLGIAWVVPETELALRTMSAVSGLCWLAGGWLLWRGMVGFHRPIAAFVTCGWLLAGLNQRFAFLAMENGLHGLVAVAILVLGLRSFGKGGDRVRYGLLGFAAALFALSRTECVLLAVMLCLAIAVGWLAPRDPRRRLHIPEAVRFGMPVLLLFGGYLVVNRVWFGSFTPVSGRVKMHYESYWVEPRGTLELLGWHLKFVRHLALDPLSDNLSRLFAWFGGSIQGWDIRRFLVVAYAVGLGWVVVRWFCRWRSGVGSASLRGKFLWLYSTFAVVHLGMMALLLPHFTGYGIWYFSTEVLFSWLASGALLFAPIQGLAALLLRLGAGGVARGVRIGFRLGAPLLIVLGGLPVLTLVSDPDPRCSRFLTAARWLDAELPPGQRVGALSSGLLGAFTTQHRVYNLDGLIASTEYFESFLSQDRLQDFIDREGIRYFADYQPLKHWVGGISFCGNVPLERLRLLRWWRFDGDAGYAIWKILPPGTTYRIGEGDEAAVDDLAELRFAAEVLGRHRVVREDELAAVLQADPKLVVANTIPLGPSGDLRHLLVPRREYRTLALPEAKVLPERRCDLDCGGGRDMYGLDLNRTVMVRGSRFVVTRYWRIDPVGDPLGAVPVRIAKAAEAEPVAVADGALAFGTLRRTDLGKGQTVVDVVALAIPADADPGDYQVWIAGAKVATITLR